MARWRASAAYRIAFVYSGAFAAGLALLGTIVFFVMHTAFTRQLDAILSDQAQSLVTEYRQDGPSEFAQTISDREASPGPVKLFYAVYDPNGRRLYGKLQSARSPLGSRDVKFLDPGEGLDDGRSYAIDLSPAERLVVVADRDWIEDIDQTVIEVFLAGFLGACLLGFGGALVLGAYLRRRLNSISHGAQAIIGGDIRGRVPVSPRHDEFDRLALTLNRMLDRIETLLENLRQVSSDIAHDLRTPLARLRNSLEQGMTNPSASAAVIQDAIHKTDDVLAMFAAILRIAEVESGETRRFFVPFDLSELTTELAESYAPAIADGGRHLLWSIEPNVVVTGDRELLAQAISNLLENAQRHTPAETLIRLTVTVTDHAACVQVVDNGPGVSKADRSRIAQRFKRLDVSRNTAGYGLGLNLVSAIAKLHHGKLFFGDGEPGLAANIELPKNQQASIDRDEAGG